MSNGGNSGSGVGDIRNLTAFLVAGFAGVLNVIGLKSAEIGVVLRNDKVWVILIALSLLLGIVIAVVSVFVNNNIAQCSLLIVSILFTSIAAYGALKTETSSQLDAVAEIGDNIQITGHYDILTLSISASKLSANDWLGVGVSAVPRGKKWNIAALCALPASVKYASTSGLGCQGDPCYYFHMIKGNTCTQISGNVIAPNASGGVQRTLKILILPTEFKHVQVLGHTCTPDPKSTGECDPAGSATRLDISIPEPS
jgi:hypothetical protein